MGGHVSTDLRSSHAAMVLALRALSYATTVGFLYLALSGVVAWLRARTASSGYLTLTLGSLALASALGQVEAWMPASRGILLPAGVVAFQLSAYALLLYRGSLLPLGRTARLLAAAMLVGSGVPLWLVGSPSAAAEPTAAQYAVAVALILAWVVCVAEPTVRLWRLAGGRPVVQRARLRAVSAGFGSIAAILLLAIGPRSITSTDAARLGFALAALALVPLLSVAFVPPAWIRRRWRRQEEARMGRGLQALLLDCADRRVLADRGLAWALRLTGADAGQVIDGDGTVLAALPAGQGAPTPVASSADVGRAPGSSRGRGRRLVAPLAAAGGRLVVLAGPFTPPFGLEEEELLERYAGSLAIALERLRLLEALRSSEERSRLLVEGVDDYAFFTIDAAGDVSSWNAGAERLLGAPADAVLGRPLSEVFRCADGSAVARMVGRATNSGRGHLEALTVGAERRRFPADAIVTRLGGAGDQPGELSVMVHDVSQRVESERLHSVQFGVSRVVADAATVEDAAPRLLQAVGSALGSEIGLIWLAGPDERQLELHRTWCPAEMHRALADRLAEDVTGPGRGLAAALWRTGSPECIPDLRLAGAFPARAEATALGLSRYLGLPIMAGDRVLGAMAFIGATPGTADPRLLGALSAVGRQVGQFVERRRAERELERIASTDGLTGLANRVEFERVLAIPPGEEFAILAIDVDELKPLNDTYGHEAGDQALRAIATTLRMSVRESDLVARIGGDEFAALLPGAGLREARALAERLRLAMHAVPLAHGQARVSVGCATGEARDSPLRVWADADEALYRAKRSGRDRSETAMVSGPSSPSALQPRWEDVLAGILSEHAVCAVYQPVVDLRSAAILGFEALARPRPEQAGLGVDGLFATAERLGEGRNLDWLCRRAAVHDAHGLPPEGLLFINVGVSALLDPVHGVDQMLLLLRWARRRPDTVVLEITEREAVRDNARLSAVLTEYRQHGLRFALDDVGAGHSTFEVLAAAVPEFVKVSEQLTRRAAETGPRSVIRAVVQFAEDSGGHVIAEGLETADQVWLMRDLNVTHGQGYGLGRPASALHWGALLDAAGDIDEVVAAAE